MNTTRYFATLIALALASVVNAANITATVEKDQVVVTIDGETFTNYKFSDDLKKPYFYPVVGPASGESVTIESHPTQYPHHNSLWFGCDKVNGANYWQDVNARGQIVSQGPTVAKSGGDTVVIADTCLWRQPGEEPVIRDERVVTIAAPSKALRQIDFEITLHPLVDITINKTNHSLFSARMMPELSVESGGTLINTFGGKSAEGTFGIESPWCDYSGTRDGETEGLAIMEHPDNRWFPSKWFTRDYGFMSPTPMYWPEGGKATLKKGEPLRLRYRVVVHEGDSEEADIAALYEEYAPGAIRMLKKRERAEAKKAAQALIAPLKDYDYGQSRKPLIVIEDAVFTSADDETWQLALSQAFIELVLSDSSDAAKEFAYRQLSLVVHPIASLLALPLLDEPNDLSANERRMMLDSLLRPAGCAHAVLVAGGVDCSDANRVFAVLQALATHRDASVVKELVPLLSNDNDAIARAVLSAIGATSGRKAASALRKAKVRAELRDAWADACLVCAEGLIAQSEQKDARGLAEPLTGEEHAVHIRAAAYGVLIKAEPKKAVRLVGDMLKNDDVMIQREGARLAGQVEDKQATSVLCSALPVLSPENQAVALAALAVRGDPSAEAAVIKLIASDDARVQLAAIRALRSIGGPKSVPVLAARLTDDNLAKAAATSLGSLRGNKIGAAIINTMKSSDGPPRAALAGVLADRDARAAVPDLLRYANDEHPAARSAALKAIGALASPEVASTLIEKLATAPDDDTRDAYENALVAAITKMDDADARTHLLIDGVAKSKGEAKAVLLAVAARQGGVDVLQLLVENADDKDPAVANAAVRALSEWSTPDAIAPLVTIAERDDDLTRNVLALRGVARLIATAPRSSPDETKAVAQRAIAAAQRDEEKQALSDALKQATTKPAKGAPVRIRDLEVSSKKPYVIAHAGLKVGAKTSIDRDYTFKTIPKAIVGATYLISSMEDRRGGGDPLIAFTVDVDVIVYLGYDHRAKTLPKWLKDWTPTGEKIDSTANKSHRMIYTKRFPAGRVELGPGSTAAMYIVAVIQAD